MMSKVPTEKENCLGNILEKAKASCCFSLPFQSHIPSCRHLFGRNSSGAADEPPASRPFHHSGRVHSKSKDDLPHHTHTHRELRRERSGSCRRTTTTTSVDRLRIASREREQSLLQSLWLQQQQQQQDFTFPRKEDANFILDKISGKKYRRGKLLGKGAFAKCYELTDLETCAVYAGKIIPKSKLSRPQQREKLEWEVTVHRSLGHENVVRFFDYFEDERNVYIVIEHCRRKSLDHVLKVRRSLTEPEARYYVRQLVEGCRYIHSQHIIHRDLKLGNMLLNGNMQVKIADFGLATLVKYEGEKKTGVCGTPNYVAPEILKQEGHSYEVDLWSIGCIIYTMLCGRPPFEMPTLRETFRRISENKYSLPSYLSNAARDLIKKLLNHDPTCRPNLTTILLEDFFTIGFAPVSLSPSFCEKSPRFPTSSHLPRPRSLASTSLHPVKKKFVARKLSSSQVIVKSAKDRNDLQTARTLACSRPRSHHCEPGSSKAGKTVAKSQAYSLMTVYKLLGGCLQCIPTDIIPFPISFHLPISVSKWIDYSNKYGFGFQLSNGSIGVNFNDSTCLILQPNTRTVKYVNLSNHIHTYSMSTIPSDLRKKFALLLYFSHYMEEHLKGPIGHSLDGNSELASVIHPTVYLKRWFRTDEALVLYLSDGTVQVNFLTDHTKLVLSVLKGKGHTVTHINANSQVTSYLLSQLCQFGCSLEISVRLRYARRMLETLINYEEEPV